LTEEQITIAGGDMRAISYVFLALTIDAQEIDNYEIPRLRIGSFGAVAYTQRGKVILVFNQYAYHGRGQSIQSSSL
jgi:hypothetical protein